MKNESPSLPVATKKTRTTIMQVAREAGVSISTVSHAFSGRRPISQEMKDQIFQVAERHGYRPHYAAQMLASRKTMNLGLLVRDATDQFFPLHLKAIDIAASNRGYRLSLGITGEDEKKMQTYLDSFCNGQVDGILVLTGLIPDRMLQEVAGQGFPIATPLRIIPNYEQLCCVQLDIRGVFRRLLNYLYDLGHRRFGFLCGNPRDVPDRYPEFHRFIEERNLPFGPDCEVSHIETTDDGESAAADLLRRHPEITALVCTNDDQAVGALGAVQEMGISVPHDLSITGYNDVSIGRYCFPKLTTIRIPISELAATSVNFLMDRIEGKPTRQIRLMPELLIRGSSGPPGKKSSTSS